MSEKARRDWELAQVREQAETRKRSDRWFTDAGTHDDDPPPVVDYDDEPRGRRKESED
jgi:hypothetical protein